MQQFASQADLIHSVYTGLYCLPAAAQRLMGITALTVILGLDLGNKHIF